MVSSQSIGLIRLDEIADKLSTLQEDVYKYFRSKINSQWKNILIEYNEQNLDEGIRPDGSFIEKTPKGRQQSTRYERYTEYLKKKRGDEIGVVNLQDTGSLRSAIDIEVGSDVIYFIDRDVKASIIEQTWGQFLGITEDQLDEFIFEIVLPDFYQWVLKRFK